jgi:hypothetical protein
MKRSGNINYSAEGYRLNAEGGSEMLSSGLSFVAFAKEEASLSSEAVAQNEA